MAASTTHEEELEHVEAEEERVPHSATPGHDEIKAHCSNSDPHVRINSGGCSTVVTAVYKALAGGVQHKS